MKKTEKNKNQDAQKKLCSHKVRGVNPEAVQQFRQVNLSINWRQTEQ